MYVPYYSPYYQVCPEQSPSLAPKGSNLYELADLHIGVLGLLVAVDAKYQYASTALFPISALCAQLYPLAHHLQLLLSSKEDKV